MSNDAGYCHAHLTPESLSYFDRFRSYGLMPCLPTDFTYVSEESDAAHTTVKMATLPGNEAKYVLRLVFVSAPSGLLLDLPATFRRGFGADWQNRIQLSEQVYLMMKRNMGDKLTCDMLNDLLKPGPATP